MRRALTGREMTPEAGEWLSDCIAGLVKRANSELRPCVLNAGRAACADRIQPAPDARRRNRDGARIPTGAIVPWVDVLEAKDADGRRIAALFSHAAHPVIVHWLSEEIGPDFPGYAVRHLRGLLAREDEPEGVFMFAQGCCGNINGHPLRGGFGACEAAGLSLAFAVTRALAGRAAGCAWRAQSALARSAPSSARAADSSRMQGGAGGG